ncbi:lactate dehydrogenase [Anaerosolibacter sp.]|uniref:lactate dehydrogenase n=1 Tax=Anaerosolibacter sp. TaxID=1872527 RepID=UPI0039EDF153
MYYYRLGESILISHSQDLAYQRILEERVIHHQGRIYYLMEGTPGQWRRSFCISDPSLMFLEGEGIHLLQYQDGFEEEVPEWLADKIKAGKVTAVNKTYPSWQSVLEEKHPQKWRVHLFGLGDVGGTLITGLRLLGGDCISEVGIYDRREEKVKRWEYEANQILSANEAMSFPPIVGIPKEKLFDCDMFVFCASTGVPAVGEDARDVRMIQFEGNREMMKPYVKMAREEGFQGIFAVVSDPVDPLCKSVFIDSNTDPETGELDYKGLAPEQIRGYGLGVMHARAAFYAGQRPETSHYIQEGRAYGPHGKDLVIADSIENYSEDLSLYLTVKARNANLEVRETGFKPYIAPALSSGSLSIISTIKGEWHYSATFMGGVYMGARNRLTPGGTEIERLPLSEVLVERLQDTYDRLVEIL